LRFTACFKTFVSTSYNSAISRSIFTLCPLKYPLDSFEILPNYTKRIFKIPPIYHLNALDLNKFSALNVH
jgi:hypothetical protein